MTGELGSDCYRTINGYDQLAEWLNESGNDWIYRGQPAEVDLETSLERYCNSSNFNMLKDAAVIECHMIRQFRRVYSGSEQYKVQDDTLYCLSLMRHYGAPTRLLDFTYSKYVATYFALECAFDSKERSSSIWCIKLDELLGAVQKKYPEVELLNKKRSKDSERNDRTFKDLFMRGRDIALWENPVQMHKRLHLQQGVALCPGNIERTFMQNLLDPYENVGKWQIIKITCKFEPSELTKAFQQFMRMNLTRESLFPELDGLAQSMKYQFWFYKELAKHNPEIYKEFIK